ncbi:uncharacterized protein LY79DRAFT_557138 [Colletotrichum navitas]|uniref:Uncharacterized protein n=1 Tax=Colletotrichum navitas TaxID=681940 RepID=A0AAD8PXH9_9PEZI|nr:uncharacterized protein LY79DRAFT_557138 [Colletotrichum navitas]KAK1585975.1 hypothetical protein LY79DRAFT_557138 [Colletotrichum navitas]
MLSLGDIHSSPRTKNTYFPKARHTGFSGVGRNTRCCATLCGRAGLDGLSLTKQVGGTGDCAANMGHGWETQQTSLRVALGAQDLEVLAAAERPRREERKASFCSWSSPLSQLCQVIWPRKRVGATPPAYRGLGIVYGRVEKGEVEELG